MTQADSELRKFINELLDDPTLDISIERGTRETTKPGDKIDSYEGTNAVTAVIKVNGGVPIDVEAYIKALPWSETISGDTRALVAHNIRTFARWMAGELTGPPFPRRT